MNRKKSRKTGKTRIQIMYDGYGFKLVSDYYRFGHQLKRRLDFTGLEAYIKNKTAETLGVSERNCTVVGRHLYMGVLAGRDVTPETAKKDSRFRELLKQHKITGHFQDLRTNYEGKKVEKGVDCELTADAVEGATRKDFDVLVLIARDGDFRSLFQKLEKLAVDSVLVWWDTPEYIMSDGRLHKQQKTSEKLINAATYNFEMSFIAEKRKLSKLEEGIFNKRTAFPLVNSSNRKPPHTSIPHQTKLQTPVRVQDTVTVNSVDNLIMNTSPRELTMDELGRTWKSTVISLNKNGFGGYIRGPVGFIDPTWNNFQFSTQDILETDNLTIGSKVQFRLKPDPNRSARLKLPLYRACNIRREI